MMTAAKKDQAKPVATPAVQPTPAPAPAPTTPAVNAPVAAAQPAAPTKQQTTLMQLSVALAKRNVTVTPEMLTMDGKFLVLNIGEAWPQIRIGVGGGIDLPQIKSYPKAFDAAIIGDQLLAKQNARLQKLAAPAPTAKPAVQTGEKKAAETATTPAQRKQKADAELEQKLEQRA